MNFTTFIPEKHYETLRSYWSQYDWVAPELSLLPSTGYVVEVDSKVVCACFVYQSNSKMSIMDWVIADKEANKDVRKQAIGLCISEATKATLNAGYTHIYTVTATPVMIETYKLMGFEPMETQATSLVYSNNNKEFLRG